MGNLMGPQNDDWTVKSGVRNGCGACHRRLGSLGHARNMKFAITFSEYMTNRV